jgi:uncharacterized membrane protein YjgN (DUF898 family)
MNWYYAHDGQQQGPVSEAELAQLARTGVIGATNLVWRDGLANWGPLSAHAPHLLTAGGRAPSVESPPAAAYTPAYATTAPVTAATAPQGPLTHYPFQFHGSTGEYFRIWIVNTALTILTLGIYAAWAKVRTRRYFYGHTTLDGAAFDYLANPISILKGNLIMGAMGLLYIGSGVIFPPLAIVILLLFFIVSPWLIHKAFRFRAWNTSYRNLRFRFTGTTGEAYISYFWLLLLTPFTLGLIIPYQMWRAKRYFFDNTSFGNSRFQFRATPGGFYAIYLKVIAFFILLAIGFGVLIPVLTTILGNVPTVSQADQLPAGIPEMGVLIGMIVGGLIYFAVLIGVSQYIAVRITNLCLNSTTIGSDTTGFVSTIRLRDMIWLQLTNLLAIVFSLGLAIPWVLIRMARYRASKTSIIAPAGGLEHFTAGVAEKDNALGDAAADVFDMDIGF